MHSIFYGLPAVPLALVGLTFYIYLPKIYVDQLGLSIGVAGTIVLLSRIWDAVLDPCIGFLSDRGKTSFGRRRPWILLAALPLAVSFFLLCSPDVFPELSANRALWFFALTFLFFLFWTAVSVPYEALGAELSFRYHERTSILSVREAGVILGTFFAGALPFIVGLDTSSTASLTTISELGFLYGLLLCISCIFCVLKTKEVAWSQKKRSSPAAWTTFAQAFQQQPFRILLISYLIAAIGAALPATLILFYVEHVLKSDQGSLFLVIYFAVGLICLPGWIWLSKKFEKKQTWLLAMAVNTGAFAAVFFLGEGMELLYGILVALSGIGYGATLAIPASMQADVIDYDELQHGVRREGQLLGIWSIAKKLAQAIGAGSGLLILEATGYQSGATQNETTIFALSVLYAAVPSFFNFLGIIVAWRYPIDSAMYESIRDKINNENDSDE